MFITHEQMTTADTVQVYIAQSPVGVTGWEKDRAMRFKVLRDLMETTKTLTSLQSMLQKITNIVVLDRVASQVFSPQTKIK